MVRRRGDWISVQAPELDNGEVAWMETSQARLDCVHWAMRVNLNKRRLYVQHNGRTMRRFVIAVGRTGNSTPQGRFTAMVARQRAPAEQCRAGQREIRWSRKLTAVRR